MRHRRRDAAHRGRRHPLRRLGLRAAALPDHRGTGGGDARLHPRLRRAARRGGAAQRAVRHQERRGVRARGEPARLAHRAVRLQDHGRAAGEPGRGGDGRPLARRARPAGRRDSPVRGGEGGGLPLQQAGRRGPGARPRDALDRRGHGHRRLVRDGLRQGADLGRRRAAAPGRGLPHGERSRQGEPGPDRPTLPRSRLQALRDRRDRPVPPVARDSRRAGAQGSRGSAQRDRPAWCPTGSSFSSTPRSAS